MADGTDIRAQVAADNLLQDEINRGLAILAEGLPGRADLRMVRILARVIETSWAEHVSFQHRVVFPIIATEGAPGMQMAIDSLRAEHKDLSAQLAVLRGHLERVLRGDWSEADALQETVERTLRQRNHHFDTEEAVTERLPPRFAASDIALYGDWLAHRLSPRFPLGLLERRQSPRRRTGSAQ